MRSYGGWLPIRLILLLAALGITVISCKKQETQVAQVVDVKVATVIQKDVPIYYEVVGQLRGSKELEVRSRVDGYIESVNYQEGTPVKKGDLLFTIDPKPFEAALTQAKGKLAESRAQFTKASEDVKRYKPLVEQNAIPRQDYETAVAQEAAAKAVVEASLAAVEQAKLNLGYCRITAQISGLAGKAEVKVGNLVSAGQGTLLTQISTVDPIHVRAGISEADYLKFLQLSKKAGVGKDTATVRPLELVLGDGTVHPYVGKKAFIDRNIDPTTGTLMIEAAFPNPNGDLRPGQYGRVRTILETRPNAILVPQRALQEVQDQVNIGVVGVGDTVQIRRVKAGPRVDSFRVIEEGLNAGERVVVEGIQKIRPGMKVNVTMLDLKDSLAVSQATTKR